MYYTKDILQHSMYYTGKNQWVFIFMPFQERISNAKLLHGHNDINSLESLRYRSRIRCLRYLLRILNTKCIAQVNNRDPVSFPYFPETCWGQCLTWRGFVLTMTIVLKRCLMCFSQANYLYIDNWGEIIEWKECGECGERDVICYWALTSQGRMLSIFTLSATKCTCSWIWKSRSFSELHIV